MTIAALYVATNGCYFGIDGVDPWDQARDARLYAGPWPVVAHPPCERWCRLAFINQKRYGHRVGSDAGCFEAALRAVRTFGGVLEHPAKSYAWTAFRLPQPRHGRWRMGAQQDYGQEWVTAVAQRAYGHRATKETWLYVIGPKPPALDWSRPAPEAQVSFCKNHGNSPLPRLCKSEAKATPPAFRDLLLSIAATARGAEEAA